MVTTLTGGATPGTDALDVFVELLSGLDDGLEASGRAFYDRLCEAVCTVTSMRRAGLLLYDDARKIVLPAGSHGIAASLLARVHGTLAETPIAQRALAEDRVVEVDGDLRPHIPARYADLPDVTTLTCTPVSAGGRWLGVIFADRGGAPFTLTEPERHAMWTLGKMAALAASARIATAQQARAKLLARGVDMARDIHERVVQRLFGVSLVLGSEHELTAAERRRCTDEIHGALTELREALSRPLAPTPEAGPGTTLRDELDRLASRQGSVPLELSWEEGVDLPAELEPLAASVLSEALRNAHRHARPSLVRVRVGRAGDALALEVRNDGVPPPGSLPAGAGVGLRLAALEALGRGGVVEFGSERAGEWHVRLVLPVDGRLEP